MSRAIAAEPPARRARRVGDVDDVLHPSLVAGVFVCVVLSCCMCLVCVFLCFVVFILFCIPAWSQASGKHVRAGGYAQSPY